MFKLNKVFSFGSVFKSNIRKTKQIVIKMTEKSKEKTMKMESRWKELYLQGYRNKAIIDKIADEFFYNHINSIYRIIDVSKLRSEMKNKS